MMKTDPVSPRARIGAEQSPNDLLGRLDAAPRHAWGAVRNDLVRRDPEARAEMLHRRGLRRIAIDWRYAQLGTLDQELSASIARGIVATALWAPISLVPLNDVHLDILFGFIERNELRLALWTTLMHPHDIDEWVESKKLDLTCEAVSRLADRASKFGCSVALYNHDGWFAQPSSLCKIVATARRPNVGIVYNFHHAHADAPEFRSHVVSMLSSLKAVNLGAARAGALAAFGEGEHDFAMLSTLLEMGYCGPLGLTCYDAKADAADTLTRSLAGLANFRRSLEKRQTPS